MENNNKTLEQIIKLHHSTRNFSKEIPSQETIIKVIESAMYAPYGGATGIPLEDIRKIFVFRQDTESITKAREIFLAQIRKNAIKINRLIPIGVA